MSKLLDIDSLNNADPMAELKKPKDILLKTKEGLEN